MSGTLLSWVAETATAVAYVVGASLSTLLHRSGPIRLRHWAEEAGGGLKKLYEDREAFEVFRYLLFLLTALCPLLLVWQLLNAERWGGGLPEVLVVAALVATVDLFNRWMLSRTAESSLSRLTRVYRLAFWVLQPLVRLLRPLATRLGAESSDETAEEEDDASDDEVDAFIGVGREEGILQPEEEELVRSLVDFGDTEVRSVMTPRIDVVGAPVDSDPQELVRLFVESGHSRLPLYDGSLDQIVGILHIRDLMRALQEEHDHLGALMPPYFVPETKNLALLLRELQARHQGLAVVVDEYGGTRGVVSIEDLLEEIFGEILDEHDRGQPERLELPDGSWRVAGRCQLEELEELFGVRLEDEEYETVGGLVFDALGHVPRAGESVERHGLRFLVERSSGRRVHTVRIFTVAADDEDRDDA